jgi:hypothetical protein
MKEEKLFTKMQNLAGGGILAGNYKCKVDGMTFNSQSELDEHNRQMHGGM